MKLRRIINKRIKRRDGGINLDSGVNAVISANVNEGDSSSRVSSRQRIVQRNGQTVEVTESTHSSGENDKREDR
jgi:hypothetical protein